MRGQDGNVQSRASPRNIRLAYDQGFYEFGTTCSSLKWNNDDPRHHTRPHNAPFYVYQQPSSRNLSSANLLFEQKPPLTRLYLMTIAKTGTEVIRTEIGNRMLIIVMRILWFSDAANVASRSDEAIDFRDAAPINPTVR